MCGSKSFVWTEGLARLSSKLAVFIIKSSSGPRPTQFTPSLPRFPPVLSSWSNNVCDVPVSGLTLPSVGIEKVDLECVNATVILQAIVGGHQ